MKNNYFIDIMHSMGRTTGRTHKPTHKKQANDYVKALKEQKKALKGEVNDLAGLFGSVAVGARSANRELASGVGAVESGIGRAATGVERELESGVGAVERGVGAAENELEKITHMFTKQKLGGARRTRTKRRRYKKRTRSTKKR
jgi:hypothetical protein